MSKKKILIIDDDDQIRELLNIFIEGNDCEAEGAATAEKGLALVRKGIFDMVILDILLPDDNGLNVLKQIKKLSPNIPVIMITGGTDIKTAEECLNVGAADYITKPFDFEYLKTTILIHILS